jgi:hypothetical protein
MALHSPFILADSSPIVFVGIVLALIFWGISSMASAMGKAKEEARRRSLRAKAGRPAMAVPPAGRPMGLVRPIPTLSRPAPRASAPPIPLPPRPQPMPPSSARAPVASQAARQATSAAPDNKIIRGSTRVTSAPVLDGLFQPKSIRAQFILAEVFKPPVGLRPPGD